jgi:hypothetical protein
MPWYTFPCLDYLKSIDIKQWEVFEWGGGCSTVWYSFNCAHVDCLETNPDWSNKIINYLTMNKKVNFSIDVIEVPPSANVPHPNKDAYLGYLQTKNKMYDVIAIDGSYRNECISISLPFIKPGGLLIFDNYEQETSGYPVLPNKYLLEQYPVQVFTQPGRDYWKTAVWNIVNV